MRRAPRPAQGPGALLRPLAAALTLALVSLSSTAVGQDVKDPFEALVVQRPGEPLPAPDLVFTTVDGRQARLSELRGKVVFLGFFTTT